MEIVIGCDHGGYKAKVALVKHLEKLGHKVVDLGCYSEDSVDYPDYGLRVGTAVVEMKYDFGIVICGSGIGISIATNKVKGVRCALLYNKEVAHLAKEHNNANVIAFGGRFFSTRAINEMTDIFMKAKFAGDRHTRRINKISKYERGGKK